MKNVKCELWDVCICNGALDYAHGNYQAIKEFYIPKYDISFNIVNDEVHVFRSRGRYAVDETNPNSPNKRSDIDGVPESFAKNMKKYLELKEKMNSKIVNFVVKNGGYNNK